MYSSMTHSPGMNHARSARNMVFSPWRMTSKRLRCCSACMTNIELLQTAPPLVCGWMVCVLMQLAAGVAKATRLIAELTCHGPGENQTAHKPSTAFCCGTRERTVSPTMSVTGGCQQFAKRRKQAAKSARFFFQI